MRAPAKAAPEPPWRRASGEFLLGLTEASTLAAAVMAAAFALALAGALWFFSPVGLAGPLGAYFPTGSYDEEGFVTREVLRLAATPATAPRLLVLGTSALAQAFGSEEALGRAVAETDVPWEVHQLATPRQSPLDQLAILETVLGGRRPGDPPLVVALGVSPQRFRWTPERMAEEETAARLGLRSEWADEEMERMDFEPRPRWGLWALDNHRLVVVNGPAALLRLLTGYAAERRIDIYADGPPLPLDLRWREGRAEEIRGGVAAGDAFVMLNRRLAGRVAGFPGVRLLLIGETLAPDFVTAMRLEGAAGEAEARLDALAREVDAPYWRIQEEARLGPGDWYDDIHVLRGAPQDRLRAAFAQHLARLDAEAGP